MNNRLPIWDDLHHFIRAGILTILFFLSPALVASGFSDNMVIRFFQTLGALGMVAFGFLSRHQFCKSGDACDKNGENND